MYMIAKGFREPTSYFTAITMGALLFFLDFVQELVGAFSIAAEWSMHPTQQCPRRLS